jgi:hypothetical protein
MEKTKRRHRSDLICITAAGSILLAVAAGWVLATEAPSGPWVTVDPDTVDFGNQVAQQTSKPKRVAVKNTGDSPLAVDHVDIRGDNPNAFSIVNDTCTGAHLDPDRACIVDITFTPARTGDRSARLKVNTNAPTSPDRVSLKGKGINSHDVQPF